MKKLLLLFCALLCLGGSKAWAATGSITVLSSTQNLTQTGSISNGTSTWKEMWQSNTTPKLTLSCTTSYRYIQPSTNTFANTNYALYLPLGYRITSYTITFKSSADGNCTIVGFGEKRTQKASATSTGKSDEQTLAVSGIATQSVDFEIKTNHAIVSSFVVSYESYDYTSPFAENAYYRFKAEWNSYYPYVNIDAAENPYYLRKDKNPSKTTLITNGNYIWKASSWNGSELKLQNVATSYYMSKLPHTNAGAITSITNDATNAESFWVIDRSAWKSGDVSLLSSTAISYTMQTDDNRYGYQLLSCHSSNYDWMYAYGAEHTGNVFTPIRVKKITFSTAVAVDGASAVSTIYVATDGSDSFTLPEGYKYTFGGKSYSAAKAAAAIKAAGTDDISVTVSPLPSAVTLENNKLYRIQQTWTQGGGTNFYFLYAKTSDATDGNRLWKDCVSTGSLSIRTRLLTDANYIWQAKSNSTNWQFYNPAADNGNGRYIAKAPSDNASTNGNLFDGLSATGTDDAESFTISAAPSSATDEPTDFVTNRYVTLKATSHTGTYLNSFTTGNDFLGWHHSAHFGYYFRFDPVKTVTFSTAVDVNGEGAVSKIYVAKDGSDAFSLPFNYKYTFGGKDYNIAAEAAAAIAAAGNEDINVTVTELSSYPITMNSDNTHAYATTYLPFPIQMASGVKAYKAVSTGTNTLILSKVADAANTADDGDILAAGTAAILWKEGATSSASLSFDVVTSSKAAPDDNLLSGTYEDASVPNGKNAYVLYGGANGVGFYPLDGTDLPLYKAYYLEDKSLPVKSFSFSFNDIVNGIQKAEMNERLSQGPVYDLSGRHIEKPMRGIYIQNGRKFIIK